MKENERNKIKKSGGAHPATLLPHCCTLPPSFFLVSPVGTCRPSPGWSSSASVVFVDVPWSCLYPWSVCTLWSSLVLVGGPPVGSPGSWWVLQQFWVSPNGHGYGGDAMV